MKKNNYVKTKNLYKIIFILVVFLGIGYAFLEATLNVEGNTTVTAPELNTYVQQTAVTTGSTTGTPTIIGNDKKEVDFSTALTNDVTSFFEETTTLVNKGTKAAYLQGIEVKVYDSNNQEVTLSAPYEYTLTKGDGTPVVIGEELAISVTTSYKIKFNYQTGTDMTTVTDYPTYTFKIVYNYTTNTIFIPSGKSKDNLAVGDEICIKEQCFNFIKYEGQDNDIVMLAKYNLKVGNIIDTTNWEKIGEYTSNDSGYGLQSSETRGYVDGATTHNGTVKFSQTNYWDDNGSPSSSYPGTYFPGPNYPLIYDATNYAGEPGTNTYSVAYYVELYKTKLINEYHTSIKGARILTYQDVKDSSIGCDEYQGCPTTGANSFITNTTFWLGSAITDYSVGYLYTDGRLTYDYHDYGDDVGVRPVVVIAKANVD